MNSTINQEQGQNDTISYHLHVHLTPESDSENPNKKPHKRFRVTREPHDNYTCLLREQTVLLKVTSFFTKNGVLLAQGAPTASGSDQVNATFKYVFDNFKYSLEVTVGEVIVQGNYAIVASTSKGSFVIKAKGETVPDNFRETFVMQKESGSWKIARYMYNKDK